MLNRYQLNPVYWLYGNPLSALWYGTKKMIALGLERLLDALNIASAIDAQTIEYIATGILIALLIAAAIFLVWVFVLWLNRKRNVSLSRQILGHEISEDANFSRFLQKGEAYAQAGEYAEAIRAEFVGLLLALEDKTGLHIHEYWTTTEIGEGLHNLEFERMHDYTRIANAFNRGWYGPKPDVSDYESWHALLMKLWQEVT